MVDSFTFKLNTLKFQPPQRFREEDLPDILFNSRSSIFLINLTNIRKHILITYVTYLSFPIYTNVGNEAMSTTIISFKQRRKHLRF